jgi:hypothetical protein
MNDIKIKNRAKLAVLRALVGETTGQDVKAIVEYQLRGYVKEGMDPFNDHELALIAVHMVNFN